MWTTALQDDLVEEPAWAAVSGGGAVAPPARASATLAAEAETLARLIGQFRVESGEAERPARAA